MLDCAHCTSCGLVLLCAYVVVVRDALHRCMDRACCIYRTHHMLVLLVMLAEGYHGIGGKIYD